MIQDIARSGEASGLDGTVQANRAGELDQGNVIAGTSEKNTAFRRRTTQKSHLRDDKKKCFSLTGSCRSPSSRGR